MFIGSKLQALRELNGYTRKELSDVIGVTQQAVWQYENDNVMPKIEILNTFQKIFNVEMLFLISGSAPKHVVHEEKIAFRTSDHSSRKKTKLEARYLDLPMTWQVILNSSSAPAPPDLISFKNWSISWY